jgi:hypothetical protein
MIGRHRMREHLTALFLLGALLILPPILLIFNRPVRVFGLPVLYLYLFLAWATVIVLAAAVTRRIDLAHNNQGEPSDTPHDGLAPAERKRHA